MVDTSSGTAATGDILNGKKAWVDGYEVNGTMLNRSISPTSTKIPEGFYKSTTLTLVDKDLSKYNIRKGKQIFGINGSVGIAWGYTPGSDD